MKVLDDEGKNLFMMAGAIMELYSRGNTNTVCNAYEEDWGEEEDEDEGNYDDDNDGNHEVGDEEESAKEVAEVEEGDVQEDREKGCRRSKGEDPNATNFFPAEWQRRRRGPY